MCLLNFSTIGTMNEIAVKVGDKIADPTDKDVSVVEISNLTFGKMKILCFVLSNGRTITYDEALKCKIQ